jgi:hypothetical protein
MADAVWPDVATARADLRTFMSDGPNDRPVKAKQLIGTVDGVNQTFLTWDDRLVDGTFAATIDGVAVIPANVVVTDPIMGIITFTPAPTQQSVVRAQYYFQYFLDPEIDDAMVMAAEQINEQADITAVIIGLKSAALNFGAHFCFQKQAIRWAQRMSSRFLLQEEPVDQEVDKRSNLFLQLAKGYYDQAVKMRDSYYMRHGRRHAPAMAVYKPVIPYWAPRR